MIGSDDNFTDLLINFRFLFIILTIITVVFLNQPVVITFHLRIGGGCNVVNLYVQFKIYIEFIRIFCCCIAAAIFRDGLSKTWV